MMLLLPAGLLLLPAALFLLVNSVCEWRAGYPCGEEKEPNHE